MIPCQNHTLGRPLTLLSSVEMILKHAIERGAHKGLNRNLSVIHNFQTRLDLSCLLSFRLVIFWNRREFYGLTAICCIGSHHSFSAPTKAKSRHSLHCTLVKHTLLFVHSKGVLWIREPLRNPFGVGGCSFNGSGASWQFGSCVLYLPDSPAGTSFGLCPVSCSLPPSVQQGRAQTSKCDLLASHHHLCQTPRDVSWSR